MTAVDKAKLVSADWREYFEDEQAGLFVGDPIGEIKIKFPGGVSGICLHSGWAEMMKVEMGYHGANRVYLTLTETYLTKYSGQSATDATSAAANVTQNSL